MLQRTAPSTAECYMRASECAERSAHATFQTDRKLYAEMAESWLLLARNDELAQRVGTMLNELNLP